ncbi:MAG TPA: ABC transporter permease [Chloroflexota bacterium]|nr:ABC transporter permease [Chloroflexota bacterium]
MSRGMTAVRAGFQRGRVEVRQIVTSADVLGWLWPSILAMIVLYVLSDRTVPGTRFSLGSQSVAGFLGVNMLYTGMLGLSVALTVEREDGTLLRMKATPNGMLGYLVGKVVGQTGLTVVFLLVILAPSAYLFDGLELRGASSWLMLTGVLVLGLIATLPLGAILGSLFSSVQGLSIVPLAIMGLTAISGVFYPITALPIWLQWIGQMLPLYWLGLGMRAALLPDEMAVVEIGGSWRHLEMVAALGAWAVFGFVAAPVVLRRMARRQSGSRVMPPSRPGRAAPDVGRQRT